MPDIEVPIASLRWPVLLVTREQRPALDGPGVVEWMVYGQWVRADIQSIGSLTFWTAAAGGEQVDTPVTHRIRMRWLDYLDQKTAILRQTRRADGTVRTETFRVRRVKELNGRKRFIEIEAELESAT